MLDTDDCRRRGAHRRLLFAAGSVVQQGVARQSGDEALRFRLLWDLVRQPRWVGGVALEAFSFVIQGWRSSSAR